MRRWYLETPRGCYGRIIVNYTEIVRVALSYSDRGTDVELSSRIDDFLRIVESRVDRVIKVQKMAIRTLLTTVKGQEYYGLPEDFAGLRDIEIRDPDVDGVSSSCRTTLAYMSPEQMNVHSSIKGDKNEFYTIIANQLQINPTQDGKILELVYYRKLVNLSPAEQINWLSNDNPDVYIFGLMVEISAFVKNAGATELWNGRFKEALGEIDVDDSLSRWSGTALQMRVG